MHIYWISFIACLPIMAAAATVCFMAWALAENDYGFSQGRTALAKTLKVASKRARFYAHRASARRPGWSDLLWRVSESIDPMRWAWTSYPLGELPFAAYEPERPYDHTIDGF